MKMNSQVTFYKTNMYDVQYMYEIDMTRCVLELTFIQK